MQCGYKYTPKPKLHSHPDKIRKQALEVCIDGVTLSRIERILGLYHRTVSLWVKAAAANLSETSLSKEVKTAENLSCAYLYTATKDANSISNYTQLIQLTVGISLIHYFSHSTD